MWFENLRRRRPERKSIVSRTQAYLLTLDEVRSYNRAQRLEDNAYLEWTMLGVQDQIEAYAGIRISPGTFDAYWTDYPNELDLFDLPVTGITGVYYTDEYGAEQTLSANEYIVLDLSSKTIRILETSDFYRRIIHRPNLPQGWRVRYTAGYANTAAVPPAVRGALLSQIGLLYKNRSDGDQPQQVVMVDGLTIQAKALLDPIRNRQ